MAKFLAIIGAGGFGREIAQYSKDINREQNKWDGIFFLDDYISPGTVIDGITVLGKIESINGDHVEQYNVICGIAKPEIKKQMVKRSQDSGLEFISLIHPETYIAPGVSIGYASVIAPRTVITVNVGIGNHVGINPQCGIGHDVVVGDYSTLYWNVNLSGHVIVKEECELGTKSTILQGITVAKRTIVGAGALVTKHTQEGTTVVGIPAKLL